MDEFPRVGNTAIRIMLYMSTDLTKTRQFEPGTTGWTARDLDDPPIERQWFNGRYEIVEGVLTTLPPAYYIGGKALYRLMSRVTALIGEEVGSFATEVEIIVDEDRVVRADAAFVTPAEEQKQVNEALAAGRNDPIMQGASMQWYKIYEDSDIHPTENLPRH